MIQVIGAFLVVIGLLFALIIGLRHIQNKQWFTRLGLPAKRIHIMESMALDQKRRIVWIRHDMDMYLVLIGGGNDLVLNGPVPYTPDVMMTATSSCNTVTDLTSDKGSA